MTVGERIKYKRELLGISQTELAKRVNISKQTLYKYENNIITNIPSDKIELIADELSVSAAYIMGWTEEEIGVVVDMDFRLNSMPERLKTYALKFAEMPKEKQEHIMNLIDMLEDKE